MHVNLVMESGCHSEKESVVDERFGRQIIANDKNFSNQGEVWIHLVQTRCEEVRKSFERCPMLKLNSF